MGLRQPQLGFYYSIITGGATVQVGLLRASVANLFHENNAKVVIADIQDKTGQAIAKKLEKNANYIHYNVSNEDDVYKLIRHHRCQIWTP